MTLEQITPTHQTIVRNRKALQLMFGLPCCSFISNHSSTYVVCFAGVVLVCDHGNPVCFVSCLLSDPGKRVRCVVPDSNPTLSRKKKKSNKERQFGRAHTHTHIHTEMESPSSRQTNTVDGQKSMLDDAKATHSFLGTHSEHCEKHWSSTAATLSLVSPSCAVSAASSQRHETAHTTMIQPATTLPANVVSTLVAIMCCCCE